MKKQADCEIVFWPFGVGRVVGMKIWNPFGRRNGPKETQYPEEVALLVERIEKFAPPQYREQRNVYYYNYSILGQYMKPLLALLEVVSRVDRLRQRRLDTAREIFLRLKDFYDLKDRLTLEEAFEERNLMERYSQLFLFFYGTKRVPDLEKEAWLEERKKQGF